MDSVPASIQVSGATDPGQRRANNEDSIWWRHDAGSGTDSVILAVADGMGGAAAGEVASQASMNECRRALVGDITPRDALPRLKEAVTAANARVHRLAETTDEYAGMGTTLTLALILGDRLFVAHVGDSRCYVVHGDVATQITADHTWVAEEREAGRLNAEEAAQHPARKAISRAIGIQPDVEVDTHGPVDLADGDTVLLCSDGLSDVVSDLEMAQALAGSRPEEAVRALASLANSRGGPDNISVVVARVGLQPEQRSASTAVPGMPVTRAASAGSPVASSPRRTPPAALLIAVPVVVLAVIGLTGLAIAGTFTSEGGGSSDDVVVVIPATGTPLPATGTPAPTPLATLAPTPTPAGIGHVASTRCDDGETPAFEHVAVDDAFAPSQIAALYGLYTDDITACQPDLDAGSIHIGEVIKVPCIPPVTCSGAPGQ